MEKSPTLIKQIKKCKLCSSMLPHSPRPVVSFSDNSKIIIIGQAPGIKVHNSGIPWDDASGDRLRDWLSVSKEKFYDTNIFGIVPMGFCYPGKGKSGDLPPRPECATMWMDKVFSVIKKPKLTLLIGQYAQNYFLTENHHQTLTETVKDWKKFMPRFLPLPHPSPRNNIWLKKNQWFEKKLVPKLQKEIFHLL